MKECCQGTSVYGKTQSSQRTCRENRRNHYISDEGEEAGNTAESYDKREDEKKCRAESHVHR